jgi:hypothetical protein
MSIAPLWPGNALVFTRSCSSGWRTRARAALSFGTELSHRNCAGCTGNTLIAIAQLCVQIDLLRRASRRSRTPSWVSARANCRLPLSDYHGVSCRETEPFAGEAAILIYVHRKRPMWFAVTRPRRARHRNALKSFHHGACRYCASCISMTEYGDQGLLGYPTRE